MNNYQINSPVLLFVFNRPDTLKKVFDIVRQAKPKVLYLVSDGPRSHIEGEAHKISQSREVVSQVDWDCKVYRLYEDSNKGLYYMMWKSMDSVFKDHDRCIFIEDDVVPNITFFNYMDILLEKYKNDINQ